MSNNTSTNTNFTNTSFDEIDKTKNIEFSNNLKDSELSDLEYENYRKSLVFYRDCPACHYAQGMVFLGIGLFTAVRMQFLWSSLNRKQILGFGSLSLLMGSIGIYKFSYSLHVFNLQGKIRKYEQLYKNEKLNKYDDSNLNSKK